MFCFDVKDGEAFAVGEYLILVVQRKSTTKTRVAVEAPRDVPISRCQERMTLEQLEILENSRKKYPKLLK